MVLELPFSGGRAAPIRQPHHFFVDFAQHPLVEREFRYQLLKLRNLSLEFLKPLRLQDVHTAVFRFPTVKCLLGNIVLAIYIRC